MDGVHLFVCSIWNINWIGMYLEVYIIIFIIAHSKYSYILHALCTQQSVPRFIFLSCTLSFSCSHAYGLVLVWNSRCRQRVNLNIHTTYALVMQTFFHLCLFRAALNHVLCIRPIIKIIPIYLCGQKIEAFHTENSMRIH